MMVVLSLLMAVAQPATVAPLPIKPVTSRALEEASIGQAVTDVYQVISGPAGQKRDWARMKTLFAADARLYAITSRGLSGGTVDDYIVKNGPNLEKVGFTERELKRRVEIYGGLAHVWSSYAGTSTDGSVNVRGINSFQLMRQPDGRWLVHSIFWQPERPGLPLPTDMEAR